MPFPSIYSSHPRTNPWNFCKKILRIGRAWKCNFFWSLIIGFLCLVFPNENHHHGFHMRYHLFLHYELFLKNLKKDFILTNMSTTVISKNSYLMTACHLPDVCLITCRWILDDCLTIAQWLPDNLKTTLSFIHLKSWNIYLTTKRQWQENQKGMRLRSLNNFKSYLAIINQCRFYI